MQATDLLSEFGSRLVDSAANQDFLKPRSPISLVAESKASHGWDPHEVWRRMIKEPRDRRLDQGL